LKTDVPFVLVEDARPGGAPGRLFTTPIETIVAHDLSEIEAALLRLRAALGRGLHAAGWLNYEAGLAFEERLARLEPQLGKSPLLWFGLFERFEEVSRVELERMLPDADGAWLSAPRPRMTRAEYNAAFSRAKNYILAGDIYQLNLSYRADITLLGDPLAAYARLRQAGGGGWSGVVHDGANWLLSTSPELFFRIQARAIEARPMKGTAQRASDPETDRLLAERLQNDPKERAENVMIVDLLRNDISRVAEIGSVHAPALFSVETYPTLHTLTSTVRARLDDGFDAIDTLRALFPCGSITGAPKIRAMQIISELEPARGVYTGSIGWLSPDGDAQFNVAIRTLAFADGRAEVGLGSAILADSDPDHEWEECSAKGRFITANAPAFGLIETMRFDPQRGLARLDLHLARLRASAAIFEFECEEASIRAALDVALAQTKSACVVRLVLSAGGETSITFRPTPDNSGAMRAALARLPVPASDFRLRHKTTLRDFYDDARMRSGADEAVFVDGDGFVTEGSISNVFVERDGVLATPPAHRGLLPGVLRAGLLAAGRAREDDVRPEDLEAGFYLGNSVRGLVSARLMIKGTRHAG
jgi:para-aminobenzoate synthetase/4-amino-4-deoxychorismate lyase